MSKDLSELEDAGAITTNLAEQLCSSELHIGTGNRQEIREKVVREFLKETPGTGTGELASKYRYFVETLSDGKRVFLTRPAWLNKGFDFEIRVQDMSFPTAKGRTTDRPNHSVIFEDLKQKETHDPKAYANLFELIERIYACQEVTPPDCEHLVFGTGLPVDLILAVIKWFFIEQDVTYWNYSGRAMFMSGVPRPE